MHLLLLLFACVTPEDTTKPEGDTDTDTDADTDTDTDTDTDVPVDEDRDGYTSDVDCDDNAWQVYPGAPEDCDGVDDDCDDAVDEDFDADGDGAFSIVECETGTDCDDTDGTIAPEAAEVAYDGIDQDCDGLDLTDVDGDGYDGGEGGLDCDDEDATAKPFGEEVAKDGIDQDCDGLDDVDGDDDGYDDADYDGDDCDDADATVHPGARDWWNDELDTNCDDHDNTLAALADAPVTISGDSGAQDLVGQDLAICDLDADTLPDLVIAAPFGESYAGQVGIFYGDGAASWTSGMLIGDADTLIQSDDLFLGFEIGCADLDGDGDDDLVTGRGEIDYGTSYDTDFELVVWYGDGAKLDASVSEADADASFTMTLAATEGALTVYGRVFSVLDLDGDGASEIVLVNAAQSGIVGGDDAFYVIGGGVWSGDYQLADEAYAVVQGEGISTAIALPDLDGDGVSEVLFGESARDDEEDPDTGDTGLGDTGDTGPTYPGRASVAESDAVATGALGDLAYGFWSGTGSEELGFAGAVGDFDGDGLSDLVLSALAESTYADNAGGVYLFAPAESAVPTAGTSAEATLSLLGATADGYFGYQVANAGDLDGDGADELLLTELGGDAGYGRVWLLDGAAFAGGASAEDAALLSWTGEQDDASTGSAIAVGDLDADGVQDFVVAAYGFIESGTNANGKVYVLLSGS